MISRIGTRCAIDSRCLFKRNASSPPSSPTHPYSPSVSQSVSDSITPIPQQKNKMPAQKPKAPEEPIPLPSQLPALPVPVKGFLRYVEQNPGVPVRQLMEPFLQYESVLRAYFAQEPEHEFVQGDHVNLISVFEGSNAELLKIHARNLAEESKEEQDKYV